MLVVPSGDGPVVVDQGQSRHVDGVNRKRSRSVGEAWTLGVVGFGIGRIGVWGFGGGCGGLLLQLERSPAMELKCARIYGVPRVKGFV